VTDRDLQCQDLLVFNPLLLQRIMYMFPIWESWPARPKNNFSYGKTLNIKVIGPTNQESSSKRMKVVRP
jgi:hypothetical protein